ncbi:MAG: hypothetical protein ACRCTZ_03465 [Sarcina sp.]
MTNITLKCLDLNAKHSFIKDFLVGLAFPLQTGIKSDKIDFEFTNETLELYYFYKPNLSTEYEKTILKRLKYKKLSKISFYKTDEKFLLDITDNSNKISKFEILDTENLKFKILELISCDEISDKIEIDNKLV